MSKVYLYSFLLFAVIVTIVIVVFSRKDELDKIDVKETWFEYDLSVCDQYFKLVECIIEKDPDENFTRQMRIDLKNEVKQMQEKWKNLSEEDLSDKCTEELKVFDGEIMQDRLKSFWCSFG